VIRQDSRAYTAVWQERKDVTTHTLQSLSDFNEAYLRRVHELIARKNEGKKTVGTFCLFVPDEIIYAADGDRVILCGGRGETISLAEQYLPRNICPLVKSSFGSVVSVERREGEACPHFNLIDMVVAEATCDAKKKMYELLNQHLPVHVIDLPQKPGNPAALAYYAEQLDQFKNEMEQLTGVTATDDNLRREIRSANETRKLLCRLFELRRRDPPPMQGLDVLAILQKQFFLSPDTLKDALRQMCDEAERLSTDGVHRPRIMISGCPMAAGNVKVPKIIEERGGVIVVEESCTGTRAFWNLVDENKDPIQAIAERYLQIPCSCMTPNERRMEHIRELVERFNVDGVVYYTLQTCHGYNIERFKVQQALRKTHVPLLAIETDYSNSDVGQIATRVDAFMEMIASSP
jgi:benzoyl-CoA reductase/2-hydroxyglutaryl-CoA dehydratase subunit BcrC/BadD/HgdB